MGKLERLRKSTEETTKSFLTITEAPVEVNHDAEAGETLPAGLEHERIAQLEAEIKALKASLERKSKRVGLLMKPSIYEKVLTKAKNSGLSFNEYMNLLAEESVK